MKKNMSTLCLAAVILMSCMPHADAAEVKAAVRINEVCTSNKSSLKDSSGKYPDWIELHNTSESAVSLAGMGLSDNKDERFSFKFPKGASIPAGGYVIVYCDGAKSSAKGEYHAPFKMSDKGETIYLTSSAKKDMDKVTVPALEKDTVYGRIKDGDSFGVLSPTPKKSNAGAKDMTAVSEPVFSQAGGFYSKAFYLTLSAPKGSTVYYTTDGSDPKTSSTAKKYSEKIAIVNNNSSPNAASAQKNVTLMDYTVPSYKVDKCMVIKAVCRDKNGNCSDTVSNSYFVNKGAAYYKDMTVISITADSADLFDSKTGIYAVGDMYKKWQTSSDYKKLDPVNVDNKTNYNQSGREWERPASIEIFTAGKQRLSENVGIRITGNYSRSYAQKSFTVYTRDEYGCSKLKYGLFDGLTDEKGKEISSFDKITIRNGGNETASNMATRFRDTMVSDIASGLDISAAAGEDCILFLNGEFWGYYSLNEKLDENYIESHYGVDKDNVTIIKNWQTEGSKKTGDDYVSFYYWAAYADMTKAANYKKFCDNIDIQSFMDYITVETYVCNNDWSNLEYVNNFMMWRADKKDSKNPYADGKWRFMLFDTDASAGMYYAENTRYDYDALGKMNTEKTWGNISALFYNVMKNEDFRDAFYENYRKIVKENFDKNKVGKLIDDYARRIRLASDATDKRFKVSNNYDRSVRVVKDFYDKRPEYALKYLEELMKKYGK